MRDFTAAGLNFSLKLGLMEYASSAAGMRPEQRTAGGRNASGRSLVIGKTGRSMKVSK